MVFNCNRKLIVDAGSCRNVIRKVAAGRSPRTTNSSSLLNSGRVVLRRLSLDTTCLIWGGVLILLLVSCRDFVDAQVISQLCDSPGGALSRSFCHWDS